MSKQDKFTETMNKNYDEYFERGVKKKLEKGSWVTMPFYQHHVYADKMVEQGEAFKRYNERLGRIEYISADAYDTDGYFAPRFEDYS